MTQAIVILKGTHSYDKSAYYEAYCRRCHHSVRGRDRQGNQVWSSKALAMKHAVTHAEWHNQLDASNWNGYSHNKKIVGEVQI